MNQWNIIYKIYDPHWKAIIFVVYGKHRNKKENCEREKFKIFLGHNFFFIIF